jgi:hypothetical protein
MIIIGIRCHTVVPIHDIIVREGIFAKILQENRCVLRGLQFQVLNFLFRQVIEICLFERFDYF